MEDNFLRFYDEDENSDVYFKRTKLSNGQLAEILFEETYRRGKYADYNVVFVIGSKRKKLNCTMMEHTTTGKVGLEGLLWAKQQIIEFEKFILELYPFEKFPNEKVYISVGWADNRRRNVYERGLKKLGYNYETNMFGQKRLRKEITYDKRSAN